MMMHLLVCLVRQSAARGLSDHTPQKKAKNTHKVIISILFAAGTHPDSEECELSRRPFLKRLDRAVMRRPSDKPVRGHGGRSEPNCTGGEG